MKTQCSYAVEVEDLTVACDARPVLWNINLKVPKGKLVAVVGLNRAGKTTLIKIMLGLLRPVISAVCFLDGDSDVRTLKSRIGCILQSDSVGWDFPVTVLDVALMGCYGELGWIRRLRKAGVELSRQMLARMGMEEYSSHQVSQFSGGQRQRAFFAWALVQEVEVYSIDEPFKGVDIQMERTIMTLPKELKGQEKTAVVVHHGLQTMPDYLGWVTLIDLRVVTSGPVEEVFHEENLKGTYRNSGTLLRSVE